jgi:hypothetical protein
VNRNSIAGCSTTITMWPSIDIINMLLTAFTPTWIQVHPDLSQVGGFVCKLFAQLPAQLTVDVNTTYVLGYDDLFIDDTGITAAGNASTRARQPSVNLDIATVYEDDTNIHPATIRAYAAEVEMLDPITWTWTLDGKPVTGNGRQLTVTVPYANADQHVITVTAAETITGGVTRSASGSPVVIVGESPGCFGPTGKPVACGCKPKTCAQLGAACGPVGDGCGHTITCGTCTAPQTCGAVTANQCGCVPVTCGTQCGKIADGCGGTLTCTPCGVHVKDPACMAACDGVLDSCLASGKLPRNCSTAYKTCQRKC